MFLRVLNLGRCLKLEQLPDKLRLQCLEELGASGTAIGEVPDSIGLLSRFFQLDLSYCEKINIC